MANLTVKTRIAGVLADVTSVTLSDPDGVFGVRQGVGGEIVVAAGTAMTRTAAGTYEYAFIEPAQGVDYTYWAEVLYAGETHHFEYTYRAPLIAVDADLSPFDELLAGDADFFLSEYGEQGIYHPAVGVERAITIIVMRQPPDRQAEPRARMQPVQVQAKPSATEGIVPGTWTDRDMMSVRLQMGGALVKLRIVRPVGQDGGLVTWELN